MDAPILTLPQEIPGIGINASDAARLSMKSAGIDPADPLGTGAVVAQVMASLKAQGIDAEPELVKSLVGQALKSGPVMKATDPVILDRGTLTSNGHCKSP